MTFSQNTAQLFVADGVAEPEALSRTTHLAVAAHQDDLEIMAYDGIVRCFQREDKWFSGVVLTDGRGSPRDDVYRDFSDEDMHTVRFKEQKKAAVVGEYAALALLDFPSSAVKDGANREPIADIARLIDAMQPEVMYTHNLADKHDTHVGVALKTIAAIRSIPMARRPKALYGCEVWRDLDWMIDADKIAFDCSGHENLQAALLGVFDSQIAGGKRYDLATMGRRRAHATYHASHGTDVTTGCSFAMNLTPLIVNDMLSPANFIADIIARFNEEVASRLVRLGL
ncbi:MAG TPA: PIG-L family deacetylase [Candidatus Hydrogenedentes bacterium]|nr:PIG-L family deacetylase [Candidatus Hydrogenedentota bacterium]HOS01565.1 PIG-L family deacetylase [Candidatus Hydrogenedentota bacterium]